LAVRKKDAIFQHFMERISKYEDNSFCGGSVSEGDEISHQRINEMFVMWLKSSDSLPQGQKSVFSKVKDRP